MKAVFALLLVVTLVNGHAVLLTPTPFNTNPSTTRACGVASVTTAMMSTAQAAWTAGDEVSITWHLVAGDGAGLVQGGFDPLGGTSFTVDAGIATQTTGSSGYYTINFVVPANLTCDQSPTKLCTFQVHSPGWFSCTAVSITPKGCTNCDPPPAPQLNCVSVTAGSLSFCPSVTSALVTGSASPSDINTELSNAYTTNLANPNVFVVPNATSTACKTLYQQLLCSMELPACNVSTGALIEGTQACRGLCQKTMEACGIQPAHIGLYDCSDPTAFPLCPGESDSVVGGGSSSKGMSAGGKAALSIFIIGFVGAVAVAGFMYNKQGHLFGYHFDMESKRVVKHQANPHNYKAYEDHEASGY